MSETRVPCPHCAELILPEAKKCRFCGEQLNRISKPASIRTLYWAWCVFMLIFFVAIFYVRRNPTVGASVWLIVVSAVVLGGIVAYLALMMRILGDLKAKNTRWYGFASIVTFFAFFALLINFDKVEAKLGFQAPKTAEQAVQMAYTPVPPIVATATPIPTPTSRPRQATNNSGSDSTNKITCTGPDGKTFQASQGDCDNFNKAWGHAPTPDPNEIIRCGIHPNCGGGYKEMTRSMCDQMVCCTVDFNNTVKFTSKDQCSREQQQNASKAWTDSCDTICSGYDSNMCGNYWAVGTQGRAECISDTLKQKSDCLSNCYNKKW